MTTMPDPDPEIVARVALWLDAEEARAALLATIVDDEGLGLEEAFELASEYVEAHPDWAAAPEAEASAVGPVTTEHVGRKKRCADET